MYGLGCLMFFQNQRRYIHAARDIIVSNERCKKALQRSQQGCVSQHTCSWRDYITVNCFNSIHKFNRRSKEVQTHQQNWWNHWFISDMSEESDDEGTLVVHKPRYGSLGMKAYVNVLCQYSHWSTLARNYLVGISCRTIFILHICLYIHSMCIVLQWWDKTNSTSTCTTQSTHVHSVNLTDITACTYGDIPGWARQTGWCQYTTVKANTKNWHNEAVWTSSTSDGRKLWIDESR